MIEKGFGIPRLQELSFLEIAALGCASGSTLEEIRKQLVEHMVTLRENSPASGRRLDFREALDNPKRYVRNTTEALKELMRLGLVFQAALPSSASGASSYRLAKFPLTSEGEAWTVELKTDPRRAYDHLMNLLWRVHPQFSAFMRALRGRLIIPHAQWGENPDPQSRKAYVDFLAGRVETVLITEEATWSAARDEVRTSIVTYLEARYASAEARGRPDPYPRNQDFISACHEAVVKLAFAKSGTPIDFISHEILRRWSKDLGIANFSYHTSGVTALRLWTTADMDVSDTSVIARRHTGEKFLDQSLEHLAQAYERVKRDDPSRSLWVPIHQVRAETCYRLALPDAVFDRALIDFLGGKRGTHLPYRINVDPAMYGNIPPSELPLRVQSPRGVRTYYSMSLVLQEKQFDEAKLSTDPISGRPI